MFLVEDKIDRIIRNLKLNILTKRILISKIPLYALAKGGEEVFLIEILEEGKSNFVFEHTLWFEKHYESIVHKFKLPLSRCINLICFHRDVKNEIDFEISRIIKNVQIFSLRQEKNGQLSYTPFLNFAININLIEEFLNNIEGKKLGKKLREFVYKNIIQRPLVCRKISGNSIMIESQGEKHYIYICKNIVFYHKGKSPFRPEIIS